MIGCSKRNRENSPKKAFEKKKKKPRLTFNPRLVLMDLQTTGPCAFIKLLSLKVGAYLSPGTYDVFNNNNNNNYNYNNNDDNNNDNNNNNNNKTYTKEKSSLQKQLFLLAPRHWGHFARRNVCDSATGIPY